MGSWRDLEVFRLAHKQGLLKVRVYSCTPLRQWEKLADEVKRAGRGVIMHESQLKVGKKEIPG